jgi:hypothetical protein
MWVILLTKRVVSLIVVPGWKLLTSPDAMSFMMALISRGGATLAEVAVDVEADDETEAETEAEGSAAVGVAAVASAAGAGAGSAAAVAGSS